MLAPAVLERVAAHGTIAATAQEPRVTVIVSPASSRRPRFGWLTVGAMAVVALVSGPVLVLSFTVLIALIYPEEFPFDAAADPISYLRMLADSSIYGSVVVVPATLVHAVIVALLGSRARDAFGWSLGSGTAIGILLAALAIWILFASGEAGGFDTLESQLLYTAMFGVPLALTGGLMGLLYWRIAIRPRRRWRLLRQHGEDAIRAME
jgi:hypothetical protein